MSELANELLELHVQHEMATLTPDNFLAWLSDETTPVLDALSHIPLNQLLSEEQLNQIIHDQVVSHPIPGAIAEIAGDAATFLFKSDPHLDSRLKDIMTAKQFQGFVSKILELETQRHQIIHQIIDLPVYRSLISNVVYKAITRYLYEDNMLSKHVPGVSSMLKMSRNVMNKAAPKISGAMEESVKTYISNNLSLFQQESKTYLMESLSSEDLESSIMDFWDEVEDKTLRELQEGMDSIDLSEFVVLGYEFWLEFRESDYFAHCYQSVVHFLYQRYGDEPLATLFEDLEITEETVIERAQRLAPQLLTTLSNSGLLEAVIRRRLASFYESDVFKHQLSA
ncbi:hypothetical protein ACFOEK_17680 [Litoribrevibacter euphylliae]|uniref:Uncharacterized protein n=1 Tax=Litoribrevibacter euphylliae TaxID=1834034 RepID=A0ABV7HJE8_9GAMM